ncbi:MAG: efflux system, outer rane lipoprotein NodT family [Pedosphaera sp.]|nr:efflux system, outer rane lipoprotein NodT family [Pedosphaera sp.]
MTKPTDPKFKSVENGCTPHWRSLQPLFSLCILMLLVAGCAVGPDYRRPAVNSPATFRGQPAATTNSLADLAWWEVYQDTNLQAFIREALTNNYDLRIAVTRVEQARAVAMQARSQFVPSISYNGNISRGRNELLGSAVPNRGMTGDTVTGTLNAFWELDLWGRVRRLNESARAQFLATEEARHGVLLSLLSDVSTAYLRLLELDQELKVAKHTTNSFNDSLKIFSQRLEGGVASELETDRAEAGLANAAAAVPDIQQQIVITENQLCILLGRQPGPITRSASLLTERMPPEVPAGLPSALLERRPDVRQAEQLLRSANANIGETVGEFFPQIGLTAFFGKVSSGLSAFTMGAANGWSVASTVSGPLFQGGRLVGQYRQFKAAREEARLRYQYTVLTAFQDVANTLVSREKLAEIREQQAREVKALDAAVRVSTNRYRAGKASYYEVLEAQQQLFPAELNLARVERDQLLAIVQLYKALGGGWETKTTAQVAAKEAPQK